METRRVLLMHRGHDRGAVSADQREEDLIKASHSNGQLEPLSSPRMSPVEDVAEDTASLVDSSDSEPPALLEFVHAGAKTLFDALHRQGCESPQAFSRDQICSMV